MAFEIPEAIKSWSQFGHPIFMWILLGMTVYALYLGVQQSRIRSTVDKETKKKLAKKKFGRRHYEIGAVLLSLMVFGNLEGMAVTYINNGKLFFGPHLLAGLGMTALMTFSVSLIPFMQRGNILARKTHVWLNVTMLGLFGWQAVTGMQIMQRIMDRMFA
ncbi:MAG: DUF4079 domain-containing protein [Cyanobacteria bacterium J06621_8]